MSARNPWVDCPGKCAPHGQSWPAPILKLQRKLAALDAQVRELELCRPGRANEIRMKASRIATLLEFAKRRVLAEEGFE